MARFRNVSGVPQQIILPSTHVKGEGRWWDGDAPKNILVPDEIVEASVESDVAYLRGLTVSRTVRVRSAFFGVADREKQQPGVLAEV